MTLSGTTYVLSSGQKTAVRLDAGATWLLGHMHPV